jgi:putative thiamine transport system permease protein
VMYGLVIAALLLQSVSLHWPFPRIVAATFSWRAWGQFLFAYSPVLHSLLLAALTSVAALAACLVWFETQAARRDGIVLAASTLVLCLPALLLALGQYRLLLVLGWTGTWAGVLLAHVVFVMAYVFIMVQGPYRAYDPRWRAVSQGLSASRLRFLGQVKLPMLKAPMLSALAVGFAVSSAQYVPSQLAGAGRISTLPVEAVTLAAGGNRALISVAGLLLMALPLLAFQLAARFGAPRWRAA